MKIPMPVFIILGVLVLGGLFFVLKPKTETTSSNAQPSMTSEQTETQDVKDFTSQKEVSLEIINYAFTPPTIRIKKGTTVTWTNRDTVKHNAIADDESFKTELIGKDESVSVTFDTAGTFPYYCGPHPSMRGTVIVEDEAGGQSATNLNTFDLVIESKKVVSGPATIKVNQGDEVTIKITSDEAEEFHVHAYDNSVELEPNKEATLTFTADMSGRFPFELENSKTEIGVLEVQPK